MQKEQSALREASRAEQMAQRMEGLDDKAKESRFNVFKISSTLQQKYDEHKLTQPIKKKLIVKQSISQRNLLRKS
jgi:osmotically-inducible protein OsmY